MKKILIINGPNLNLLGQREKNIYGNSSLEEINAKLRELALTLNLELEFFQSNIEGELINSIQKSLGHCDYIIINAGAYTHTSIGIRDALAATGLPFIEVHLSNIDKREEFRKTSYLSDLAQGVIYGFGPLGYELALYGIKNLK
jgi:3-dehydroquinate dehydratase-2